MEVAFLVLILVILDVWVLLTGLAYIIWCDSLTPKLFPVTLEIFITGMTYLAFWGVCSCW